jgi:hypothetical protein
MARQIAAAATFKQPMSRNIITNPDGKKVVKTLKATRKSEKKVTAKKAGTVPVGAKKSTVKKSAAAASGLKKSGAKPKKNGVVKKVVGKIVKAVSKAVSKKKTTGKPAKKKR